MHLPSSEKGKIVEYTVKIFNHSELPKTFIIEPNRLKGFNIQPDIASLVFEPWTEGERTYQVKVSKKVQPGLSLLLFNIKFDSWDFSEWNEFLIEILP
jgi:hypothetical protein